MSWVILLCASAGRKECPWWLRLAFTEDEWGSRPNLQRGDGGSLIKPSHHDDQIISLDFSPLRPYLSNNRLNGWDVSHPLLCHLTYDLCASVKEEI